MGCVPSCGHKSAATVLIAMAAKNGIVIVEFAKGQREQGKDIREAAVPVMMTSFAFSARIGSAHTRRGLPGSAAGERADRGGRQRL
jgi:hypothetical protein